MWSQYRKMLSIYEHVSYGRLKAHQLGAMDLSRFLNERTATWSQRHANAVRRRRAQKLSSTGMERGSNLGATRAIDGEPAKKAAVAATRIKSTAAEGEQ